MQQTKIQCISNTKCLLHGTFIVNCLGPLYVFSSDWSIFYFSIYLFSETRLYLIYTVYFKALYNQYQVLFSVYGFSCFRLYCAFRVAAHTACFSDYKFLSWFHLFPTQTSSNVTGRQLMFFFCSQKAIPPYNLYLHLPFFFFNMIFVYT